MSKGEFWSEAEYQDGYAGPENPDGEEDETMGDERKTGSGITTRMLMQKLREVMVQKYKDELKAMSGGRVGLKPKQVADLVAGYEDGFRAALMHLKGMGVIVIVEDPELVDATAAEKKA